ncbi:hypothetical protein ANCDUO_09327 [Ancylostoma duodenale]|uniref:Uncharacterized protein n=1 Tax=Ancylostoma duodenale TaxID=51022 RepID=A0A0C2DDC5_9BILA|nr:hypothetical protein ANCDUO_09327 [Ancylostoma duodenale]
MLFHTIERELFQSIFSGFYGQTLGYFSGFDEPRSSVIMFFAATRKSDVYKNYKRFAREHHGDYHLTELIDKGIEKWAHQPAFVAMKPLETISKANTLYDDITFESMAEFIEENLHPSVLINQSFPTLLFHARDADTVNQYSGCLCSLSFVILPTNPLFICCVLMHILFVRNVLSSTLSGVSAND